LSSPTARVLRKTAGAEEGEVCQIPADELVLGDIVMLEDGDQIPADIRLISVVAFAVDEAILTGESVPVTKVLNVMEKDKDGAKDADGQDTITVGDRKNQAFFGCTVSRGRATGIVVGVGMGTELGKIAKTIGEKTESKTNLQHQLETLAIGLFFFSCFLGVIVIAVNEFKLTAQVGLYAIALGVAIIPEGLVAVVTVCYSVGVSRMAKQNTIVRKLVALEVLGAVTDICSDKTGTLTMAKMVVRQFWIPENTRFKITGAGIDPTQGEFFQVADDDSETKIEVDSLTQDLKDFITVGALCNTSNLIAPSVDKPQWTSLGDPTEVALTVLAAKAKLEKKKIVVEKELEFVQEYPFDSSIKRMSVVYKIGEGKTYSLAKGALESIYGICSHIKVGDEILPLEHAVSWEDKPIEEQLKSPYSLASLQLKNEKLAGSGLRVLAFATKMSDEPADPEAAREHAESGLVFMGLVGMYDPPREETLPAVQQCKQAGIIVRMVTGDHPKTAAFIAKEVEIIDNFDDPTQPVLPASAFDAISDDDLDKHTYLPRVVARCSPDTKVKMVGALHRRNRIVAMTGDGVNDAPSIKKADVGIAMGMNGSDVTKQAAAIVLTDDNFSTIVQAVKEGRRMTDNIVKFVIHLMSGNVAEVVVLVCGLGFKDSDGYSVYPMSPLQILWVNMVTSSPPALGLAMENAEPTIMDKKPIGRGHVLIRTLVFLDTIVYGGMIGILSLANFIIVCFAYGEGTLNSSHCGSYKDSTDIGYWTTVNGQKEYVAGACDNIFRARGTCFGTCTLLILFHAYNCKDLTQSIFQMKKDDNSFLFWAVCLGVVTLIPTLCPIPVLEDIATEVFYQKAISWEWAWIVGAIFVFMIFAELYKMYIRPPFAAADEESKKGQSTERRGSVDVDVGGIQLQIETKNP